MRKWYIILLTTFLVVGSQGCKWQDDFRAREQPSYLQQTQSLQPPPKPTLNKDSEDYQGDDTNLTEQQERATKLPAIDSRNVIPEVPEYPAGVEPR